VGDSAALCSLVSIAASVLTFAESIWTIIINAVANVRDAGSIGLGRDGIGLVLCWSGKAHGTRRPVRSFLSQSVGSTYPRPRRIKADFKKSILMVWDWSECGFLEKRTVDLLDDEKQNLPIICFLYSRRGPLPSDFIVIPTVIATILTHLKWIVFS
jgi:hypothetical protein